MIVIKVVKAVAVRCALLLHTTMTVWRVTVDLDNPMYWMLSLALIPFIIEGFYTIVKRKGDDFLIFTPCFFFYLTTTIPCVWLLELNKTESFIKGDVMFLNNATSPEIANLPNISPATWTILIEELLLYLLIISRWVLPRGSITREQLSELLFAFIGIASDIMEMFSLFGESQVRTNTILSYCLLAVWSLSVLQFSMTVTVTHQPKRAKKIKVIDYNDEEAHSSATIRNEILAIMVSMFMQDIPFLTLRLYTIVTYNLVTYSLIFFTSKNILVICLLLYKIAVLLQKRYCPEINLGGDDEEEEEEEVTNEDVNNETEDKKSKNGLDDGGVVVEVPEKDELLPNGGTASSGSQADKDGGDGLQKRNVPQGQDSAKPGDSKVAKDETKQGDEKKNKELTPKETGGPTAKSTPKSSRAASSQASSTDSTGDGKKNAKSPASANTTTSNLPTPGPSVPGTPVSRTPKVSTPRSPRAPTSNTPRTASSQPQPKHQTVSSGYGWVSSKPKTENVALKSMARK